MNTPTQEHIRKLEAQHSDLAEHCEKRDHKIDFDGTSVIETERNLEKGSYSNLGIFSAHLWTSTACSEQHTWSTCTASEM